MNHHHELYMERCLTLASQGLGSTRSNPMVGCVVVQDNKIISEGFHKVYGGPHAEADTLENIEKVPETATVYVNLEPCSHTGKTPPCADLLIQKEVRNVVVSSLDPNPLVAGNGLKKLKDAGVNVVTGVLEKKNRELNKRFFTFHEKKRPYIILKWAQSLDGFIAPEHHEGSFRLTSHFSDILVHQWRSHEMGIVVGRKTVEVDDPQLTVRHVEGINPLRIVLDPGNRLKEGFHVLDGKVSTVILNTSTNEKKNNTEWIKIPTENFLKESLKSIHGMNILSLMIEGGTLTLDHFIRENLWDEARVFTSPKILHKGVAAPRIGGKMTADVFLDKDRLTTFIPL